MFHQLAPFRLKPIKGLGLLELMLVLSILAVMLLVSIRYYSSANAQQEASTLVNSFNLIRTATQNYIADHQSSFPSLTDLVAQGYLPSSFGTDDSKNAANNMWGGAVSLSSASNGTFSITQANVPGGVCNMAIGQLASTINKALGESVTTKSTGKNPDTGEDVDQSVCGSISTITVTYIN